MPVLPHGPGTQEISEITPEWEALDGGGLYVAS